jgi:hypothetical protein
MKVQDKILMLNECNKESKQYTKLYEEILRDLVSEVELYTIIRKGTLDKETMQGIPDIYCGLSFNNIPSIWIFTEESIASNFTNHYGMIQDTRPLYTKITIEQLIEFFSNAVFSGISKIIIDEGENTFIVKVYEFISSSLLEHKENVVTKDEFMIIDILNQMKFEKKKLWVIPSKKANGEDLIFNRFVPLNDKIKIKIYDSQEICENESLENGFKIKFAVPLDVNSLFKIIENSHRIKIEDASFQLSGSTVDISIKKVLNILMRIT